MVSDANFPRVRPRFDIPLLRGESERFLLALIQQLRRPDSPAQGRVLNDHVELTTCAQAYHVWSPRLQLHVIRTEEGEEMLSGQFSPHPNVWTGFMALYGTLALGVLFALAFGVSQWSLDMTPWALWGALIAVVLMGLTYGAAFIGQGLGAEEMYTLRVFLDDSLRRIRGPGTEARVDALLREAPRNA